MNAWSTGLLAFRAEYRGRLWVEVMLLAGINDTPEALADLAAAHSPHWPRRSARGHPRPPAGRAVGCAA